MAAAGKKRPLEVDSAVYYWNEEEKKVAKGRIDRQLDNLAKGQEMYVLKSGKEFCRKDLYDAREDVPQGARADSGSGHSAVTSEGSQQQNSLASGSGGQASEQQSSLASGSGSKASEQPSSVEDVGPAPKRQRNSAEEAGSGIGGAVAVAPTTPPQQPPDPDAQGVVYAEKVSKWIAEKAEAASKSGKSLVQWAQETFPPSHDLRAAMTAKVPWPAQAGYTSFLRKPASKTKGHVHICMLNFGEKGLHGKGMYALDASLWLRHLTMPLSFKRLDIIPVMLPGDASASGDSGGDLGVFGYGADGAMVNSTILFAMSSLVLFSIESGEDMPEVLKEKLQNIRALCTKHDNASNRLVNSMLTSAVNQKMNRSMDDPLILAGELIRSGLASGSPASSLRTVTRLYRARTMNSPTLAIKRSTEEATIRVLDRSKMCEEGVATITRITLKTTWDGPLSADAFLAPKLVLGGKLVDSSSETWNKFAVQTAKGQTVVLIHVEKQVDRELASGSALTKWSQDTMDEVCGVFGLWHKIHEQLLPALLLPPKATTDLCDTLEDRGGALFESVSQLLSAEPPADFEDESAMLSWIVKQIPALRRAQEEHRRQIKCAAESSPSAILNEQEKKI